MAKSPLSTLLGGFRHDPETFFITPDGKIAAKFVGPLPIATMEALLEEMLTDE